VRKISKNLGPFTKKVGVFVNEDKWTVLEMLSYCNLDFAQLHGEESVEYCSYIGKEKVIKVFRIPINLKEEKFKCYLNKIKPYEKVVSAILIDTKKDRLYGGTGEETNWNFVKFLIENVQIPIILSGGIGLDNIERAKKIENLYGVDANSKLEIKPGIKDLDKVKTFILKAKCK
ncbi:MAG TPA: phosphoribosylanthranilate isomerase, partial [Desulfurobacteriaceae bacterium]|nr:phosphoribosylanthranilate isomerase [Desulfurobacteriaceae bacterium]